jgi:chromosome segregation ATPase
MQHKSISEMIEDFKQPTSYFERLINQLMADNKSLIKERDEHITTISDLKTDLEDAQEHYDDYSALWNKMVDERDAEIERLRKVCANIKHGKDAQIIALDKEVDELKAELAEEKVYTEKSLEHVNAAEQQLITENYQLKTRIDVLTEMYETQTMMANDAKNKLAQQTSLLNTTTSKLIAVQNAVLSSSSYMAQVIASN